MEGLVSRTKAEAAAKWTGVKAQTSKNRADQLKKAQERPKKQKKWASGRRRPQLATKN